MQMFFAFCVFVLVNEMLQLNGYVHNLFEKTSTEFVSSVGGDDNQKSAIKKRQITIHGGIVYFNSTHTGNNIQSIGGESGTGGTKRCNYEASSYNYDTFYKIDEMCCGKSDDYALNTTVFITGLRDAHILLSSTSNPASGADHYEIDVGVNWNKQTEIRLRKFMQHDFSVRTRVDTENILSADKPTAVHLKAHVDGTIEVSFPGTSFSNVIAKYDNPIPINYISFTTYLTKAHFVFNCRSK